MTTDPVTLAVALVFLGKRRYSTKLWKAFQDVFNCMPVAALVDNKIFCCHGGLSPSLRTLEQVKRLPRPADVNDTGAYLSTC